MFVLFRNCPPCGSEQTKSVERQEVGGGLGANSQWGKSCLLLIRKKLSMFTKDVAIPLTHNLHPMSSGKAEVQFLHGRTQLS